MDVQVANDTTTGAYQARVEGAPAGVARYERDGDVVVFTHTEVPDAYEGEGVGSALVAGALDDVRSHGLSVRPVCPFVRGYIERHPEYGDLVEASG